MQYFSSAALEPGGRKQNIRFFILNPLFGIFTVVRIKPCANCTVGGTLPSINEINKFAN